MMCEECGIRPATIHLMTFINNERAERNLCPVCMAKYQQQIPGIEITDLTNILNSILAGVTQSEEASEDEEEFELACEQCGMTYAEFRKGGMLGCSACYKAFRTPLEALLQRVHGNTQHAGRIPGSVRTGISLRMSIDRLRQKLDKAIREEEFEQAAKLRDSIRALTAQLEQEESGDIRVYPPERIEDGGNDDE